MCIIIDANTISKVFNEDDINHKEFKPLLDWILNDNGKIVYGGSKYFEELELMAKYRSLFIQLGKARKTVEIPLDLVDFETEKAKEIIQHKDFDDQHLVGLVRASKCKLVCTSEKRAIRFLKNSDLYVKSIHRPKIYSSSKNADLLCKNNIAKCCK